MATIQDFGIPEIGTGILQPKLKNRWRVVFFNFGGAATSANAVSAQAINVTRPNITWDEVPLDRYNSRAYVAAKHSWQDMTITIDDDVTSTAAKAIQEQIQKQQYMTGVEGPWLAAAPEASVYKFTTRIDMLDGNEQVIEQWYVEGCWIKTADYTDLDYSASEKVTINLTIRFDHARQSFGQYSGGQGLATGF